MQDIKSIRDHLLTKAFVSIQRIEDILFDIYEGSEKAEEECKLLETLCKDLEELEKRLRLENGKLVK